MRTILTMLVLTLVFALVACAPPEPPPAPDTSAEDEAAVRAHVETFVASWNAGDLETIAGMIDEGVIQMPQNATPMKGRDAVLAHMEAGYDPTQVTQSATVEEVETMGDFALAFGSWTLTPTESAGEDVETQDGTWMVLYKRGGDGWKMYRWTWNQYTAE